MPKVKAKPAREITDRAKRYRANAAASKIKWGSKRCHYCGNPKSKLQIDHVDGIEAHGEPKNLGLACRPCNTLKGLAFQRAGLGELTAQYNPENIVGIRVAAFPTRAAAEKFAMYLAHRQVKTYMGESGTSQEASVFTSAIDAKIGKSVLRQFERSKPLPERNPKGGAKSWQQWATAVLALKGQGQEMSLAEARDLVRETPAARRSEFAREIWDRRRSRYGDSGGARRKQQLEEVPF